MLVNRCSSQEFFLLLWIGMVFWLKRTSTKPLSTSMLHYWLVWWKDILIPEDLALCISQLYFLAVLCRFVVLGQAMHTNELLTDHYGTKYSFRHFTYVHDFIKITSEIYRLCVLLNQCLTLLWTCSHQCAWMFVSWFCESSLYKYGWYLSG